MSHAYIFSQMLKMMNDGHNFEVVFFEGKLCFLKHIYLYLHCNDHIKTGKIVFDWRVY